jgi:hypothetical protein
MAEAEALFFSHPFWLWLALGGVFLIVELMTGSGWALWPAGAAAATGVVTVIVTAIWPFGWGYQVVFFVVTAIIATYVGRRFLPPAGRGKGGDINDPSPRLVGHACEAAAPFKQGIGRVFIDGKEWAAELEGGGDLAAKSKVEVTGILGGSRLKVKAG